MSSHKKFEKTRIKGQPRNTDFEKTKHKLLYFLFHPTIQFVRSVEQKCILMNE